MKFSKLAEYFSKLEETSSRNAMTEILADLFSRATVKEIGAVCYLSLGRLGPQYESLEFQLADRMVIRVIAQAFGATQDDVKEEYKTVGDLGEVVEKYKKQGMIGEERVIKGKRKKAEDNEKVIGRDKGQVGISVSDVYMRLKGIAQEAGEGSQQRKVDSLALLFYDLDSLSCKYVARMVVGKLRLGFSDVTILDALSWMEVGSKDLRSRIEQAYFVHTDIAYIARLFKERGIEGLEEVSVELGVSVMPALCQRLKSADEMIKKMGEVIADPKYDGQRVQIHYRKLKAQSAKRKAQDSELKAPKEWQVRAFTRNLEEVAFMFPELKRIGEQLRAKELILDSEAVGYDSKTGRILPFQEIITRKRKHAIDKAAKEVPLRFFVFDLLYINGRSMLDVPLVERLDELGKVLYGNEVLVGTPHIVTSDAHELRKYHEQQLKEGLEGIVVKKLHDRYIPGRRGWSWVKFKEEEEKAAKLSDTLDCVVMGYYRGKGKRTAFGIGGFLVGVINDDKIVTVSKIGTGLSDEQWREMKTRVKSQETGFKPKEYAEVEKSLIPDVWVDPQLVVEIAADNITKSPVHSAGVALRFPRLVRFRDDKDPQQATTVAEVKGLYRLQG